MKNLRDMMDMTFSTPGEGEQKQKRMLDEINQRRKTSREYIDQLSVALTQERDRKVRARKDQLDEIKQLLQQARRTRLHLRTRMARSRMICGAKQRT
jgi:hypothetical protein